MGFATATLTSLTCLFVPQMTGDISVPGLFKRDHQCLEFIAVQAGKSA